MKNETKEKSLFHVESLQFDNLDIRDRVENTELLVKQEVESKKLKVLIFHICDVNDHDERIELKGDESSLIKRLTEILKIYEYKDEPIEIEKCFQATIKYLKIIRSMRIENI